MDSLEIFTSFIEKKGLKKTSERLVMFKLIKKISGHFDADDLLAAIIKNGLKISRASVYRTILLLVEAGLISETLQRDGRTVYEYGPEKSHHDHMICVKCGKLIEFSDILIEKHQKEICKKHKFEMTGHKLEIKGICSACR
jgi:Fur family ferric uptake transcriptional regulator